MVDEGRLVSVSGMPVYNDKSHEELRWEDYHFGDKGSLIFGAKPSFGASSTTGFRFSSTQSFGQPTIPAVSSSFLGTTQSCLVTQSLPSGGQARIPTLGSTGFGQSVSGEKCGSGVSSYEQTVVDEGRLVSVSGMPVYNDKSHEELRWEDNNFGDKGSSIFGAKPAFGASSTTGFGFSSTPSFGQPTIPAVNSSFLGITTSPFGTQSSPSGSQERISTLGSTGFGQSVSGGKCGSRVSSYEQTMVDEGRLVSVSGMPVYNDRSHEELRWEDYHFRDRGYSIFGGKPAFGASSTTGFGFSSTPSFGQPTIPAVSSSFLGTTQSPFGTKSSPSVGQARISTLGSTGFGQSVFGEKCGSRVSSYEQTMVDEGRLVSVSGMPIYNDKSHEELRWEDYHFGDKGSSLYGGKRAFGASSTTGFCFSSTPSFGQPTIPAVSSSFLGTTRSPFGTQSLPSGGQARIPTLGSTGFGQLVSGEKCGSRVSSYEQTVVEEGRLVSVSGMPVYNDKSHEELRWEDYHFGDKGSSIFVGQKLAFGASSTTGFDFSSTPSFGQPTIPAVSSGFLGTTQSPFGTRSSPSGGQARIPSIGSMGFGLSFCGEKCGRRVSSYKRTVIDEGRLVSVSVYNDKSHEELRWKDYHFGDKGGSRVGTSTTHPKPFTPFTALAHSLTNTFTSLTLTPAFSFPVTEVSTTAFSSSPFGTSSSTNSLTLAFGPNSSPLPFGPSSSPAFTSSPSIFNSSTSSSINPSSSSITTCGPNSSPSLFGPSSSPAFTSSPSILNSTPSIFSSTSAATTNSVFSSGSCFTFTQSSPLFTSIEPSSNASFLPSKPNTINSPSTTSVFERNLFSCIPSQISRSTVAPGQTIPSFSTTLQPAQTAQIRGSSGVGGLTGGIGQSTAAHEFASLSTAEVQPPSVVDPFGTPPAMPQPSIAREGPTSSLQFGISSIPVLEKQALGRVSLLLTIRHLSQSRNRLPVQKYDPRSEGRKVPFFGDDCEIPTPAIIPRENPRSMVIRPAEHWPMRVKSEKFNVPKRTPIYGYENSQDDAEAYASVLDGAIYQDENGNSGENNTGKERANGDAAPVYEHSADLTALLPKLRKCSDYYTEPQIQDLASKERVEPGFISRVKDFVIGRHGYGSIKFLGLTDVQQLNLESLIQFNNQEVIVYLDNTKKHPVGQGLNKPFEVALLNIKCIDKRTGKHYIDGPKTDKYREMLMKAATDQGAEFVSYDPVEGEWKFRVQHFD